jgi:hypothetical protein
MKTSMCRPGPVLWLAGYQVSGDHCQVCKRPLKAASCHGGAGETARGSGQRVAMRAMSDRNPSRFPTA